MNKLDQKSPQTDVNRFKHHLIDTVTRMMEANSVPLDENRQAIIGCLEQIYQANDPGFSDSVKTRIFKEVLDEVLGFGPLQPLLDDPDITEVMVNGINKTYVERNGKITRADVSFADDAQIIKLIERIILPLGRTIDANNPTVDARLPDGSRVNAVIPPVMIEGPCITIRKFQTDKIGFEQLIEMGSITENMVQLLRACVIGRLNILISGGTGSGKTTLLNILSGFIPDDERIITIEDAAELQLQQEHVLKMETKPPNIEGKYEKTIRDLVINSLRMRPDRIVVGECRSGEALDMLQAMNTGHDGSLTTVHANSPRDAVGRLETLCLMAGLDLPIRVISKQIASAIDVIIQVSRFSDGSRKVTSITEISGMEGDVITMTEIFKFEQRKIDHDGTVIGELTATGVRPFFSQKLKVAGLDLGPELFNFKKSSIW
ncbi:CpaF family protein [Desulfobacula toluolica]|uniref:Type II secretion system protein E n=1 Tax=Desulfobacula toluolica (strain DSM 7467 / Tol2) TaxID=651182 RepID=K0NNL2_DESTT|nr:CpaF family protein [Desulfobacula toluolica]CCK81598.1 type II secretion system protein E [Desulfobacula toluolica Tol2]